jgi:excisionase family DNA binding protein
MRTLEVKFMSRAPLDPIIPSVQDTVLAASARHAIASGQNITMRDLPPVVTRLLVDILKETEIGNVVALIPVEAEITTQQAADLLQVSRPFVVKGTLAGRTVGKHRRLPLRDVLAYKAAQFATREHALDEIVALDQELGLL